MIKTDKGKIFGGFADTSVTGNVGEPRTDGNTWIFYEDTDQNFKRLNQNATGDAEIASRSAKKKLEVLSAWGDPKNGGWTDTISLRSNADKRDDNACYSLANFEVPKEGMDPGSPEACKIFAGANRYRVAALEVYKVSDTQADDAAVKAEIEQVIKDNKLAEPSKADKKDKKQGGPAPAPPKQDKKPAPDMSPDYMKL